MFIKETQNGQARYTVARCSFLPFVNQQSGWELLGEQWGNGIE